MVDATIIQPNCSLAQALNQNGLTADKESVRLLGFPKQLYEFDIEIERKVLSNRETVMSTTVDLLTGTSMMNDIYPDLASRSFSPESLLNPSIDEPTAAKKAHAQVRRRTNSWYKTFSTPQITVQRQEKAFKLFWLVPSTSDSKVTMIDTITGQVLVRDIRLDEPSELGKH